MDEESIFQEFDRLESKVESLIRECNGLRAQNSQIQANVEALELELLEKDESETRLLEEKALVRSRIDSLLARFSETPGEGSGGQD